MIENVVFVFYNVFLFSVSVDLEQVITLSLALLLAAKYVFFEQAEAESSLQSSLTNRRAGGDCCLREPVPPKALKGVTDPNSPHREQTGERVQTVNQLQIFFYKHDMCLHLLCCLQMM